MNGVDEVPALTCGTDGEHIEPNKQEFHVTKRKAGWALGVMAQVMSEAEAASQRRQQEGHCSWGHQLCGSPVAGVQQ